MANQPVGPPGTIVSQPQALVLPVIPKAVDLPSAIQAVNALTQAIQILTNAIPSANQSNSQTAAAPVVASSFQQVALQTSVITITDPNDSSVAVQVEQITGLTMYDPVTKQTWQWSQSSGGSSG